MTDGRRCLKAARVRSVVHEQFIPQSEPTSLGDGEIHVWFFPLWPDSRDSARSPIMRKFLSHYLATAIDQVNIDASPNGKPLLRDGRMHFNVSHSGGALLFAVSRHHEVGVDLESSRRPRRVLELARRWFDPAEASALQALPESLRQRAFLNLWTCKEAVLKADGRGIAGGLDRIAFAMTETGEITSVVDRSWNVVRLEPAPAYPGAVAWRGPDVPVRAFLYTAK